MYKFYGTPLKVITSKGSGKPIFRFDTKGEFITDDPIIIDRAKGYFDYLEFDAEVKGVKVKKTHVQAPMTITNKNDKKKDYSYKELQALAKERDINPFGIKKDELRKLLEV